MSEPSSRVAPRPRWRQHAARIALAPAVALLAYAAFPRGPTAPGRREVGSVAESDVIAPVRFLVLKEEAVRVREAEDLAATVKPVVTFQPEAARVAVRAADRFFAVVDSVVASGGSVVDASRLAGVALEAGEAAGLARPAQRSALRAAVLEALRRTSDGYLAPGVSPSELGREAVVRAGGSERVVSVESLRTFSELLARASPLPGPAAEAERLRLRLVGEFFRPTLVYERAETEGRRDVLRRGVDSVEAVVLAGQKIVGAHEVVTADVARRIDALRAALRAEGVSRAEGVLATLGGLGLNTLILVLLGIIVLFYRPEVYRSFRSLSFLAGGLAVVTVTAGLLARQSPPRIELIPVALPAILLAILYDSRIAAVAAMTLATLIGAQPALRATDALVFCFVGGVAAAISMGRIRSRTQAYTSVAIVAAIYAAAAAVSGAAGSEPLRGIGTAAALGGLNALGSAALAMLVLPMLESFTRITTDLRLLELSDPDHPLLRRLATEAPGTYAHSIAMANLCEAACNAIGANGLLARVGCYYHDVGKLTNPQCFVENQGRGKSPHDQMTPEQSAVVIRRHVEDGLALARRYRLPEVIRRFIPEHHGTQQIGFFLGRAREENSRAVRSELFRYPGPLPQSAETAVSLLADAVEAALRVLDEPTPERLRDAIDHLVEVRLESGQLSDAPLTLRQIEAIKREFLRVLSGIHHTRVEYPEDAGGITADWETARTD